MKTLFIVFASLLLLAAFVGCGTQETPEDTGAAGHPEEVADSTRLDSAMTDMEEVVDSAAAAAKEAAEEAVGDAVEEVTGH